MIKLQFITWLWIWVVSGLLGFLAFHYWTDGSDHVLMYGACAFVFGASSGALLHRKDIFRSPNP